MQNLKNFFLPRPLLAVLPCILVVVCIDLALHAGLMVPVPFILVLLAVIVAGIGGFWSGVVGGLVSSAFFFHVHADEVGPEMLTGTLAHTAFAAFVFATVGVLLGRLKDKHI